MGGKLVMVYGGGQTQSMVVIPFFLLRPNHPPSGASTGSRMNRRNDGVEKERKRGPVAEELVVS